MNARLRVEGLKEAVKRLDDVGLRARRPEPVLRSPGVLRDLLESEERRFATNRGWKKLTPKWAAEKRRKGLDPRILRATRRLEHALTTAKDSAIVFGAFNSTMTWGIRPGRSDLYYAQPLAKGTKVHPPRKMVRIDVLARNRISGKVEKYIAHAEITP